MARCRWIAGALIVLYLVMAATTTQLLHFSRALDEGYHLEYILFIKDHGRLPVSYEERAQITKSDFPPLYHLLVSLLSAGITVTDKPALKYYWDSFRYRVIDYQSDDVPWTFNTEDFTWPYLGQFQVWQIGRWLSVGLSLGTLVVIFFILQTIPIGPHPITALFGTAFLAFMPRYLILASALNDDNLLGLIAATYFLMMIKAIKHSQRWWPFVAMGALLGLAMTVKYSVVLLPLEVMVVCAVLAWRQQLGWLWAVKRILVVALFAILFSSWWFGWNFWYLNTVAQDGWLAGLIRPLFVGGYETTLNRLGGALTGGAVGFTELPAQTSIGTFPQWLRLTFVSFWGFEINNAIPLYPYIYGVIGLLLVGVGAGIWRLWQRQAASHPWLLLAGFHLSLFVAIPLLRFGLSRRLGQTAQGRHILVPAAAVIVALIAWGLVTVIPQKWRTISLAAIIVGLIGWTGLHLYYLTQAAAPPLPLRTVPEAAAWLPEPIEAQFGSGLELVSYDIELQPDQGRLNLQLGWRSLAHVNENYLLMVRLVDQSGASISHWLGYNGQGRLPTLAWDAGDSIFDRLALPLPDLPPQEYRLEIQMLDQNTLAPIDQTVSLPVVLDQPVIHASAGRPQAVGDVTFTLWQAKGPVETLRPNYRYPATISVVANTSQSLHLLDPDGRRLDPLWHEANIYTFVIGPRWISGPYRLRLSTEQGPVTTDQTILTVENWWPRQFEVTEKIEVPAQANFANQFEFLGYTLPQKQVKAGAAFPVTLYWRALPDKSPEAHFIQFNNLLDRTGTLYGGYDRVPLEYYSTLLWAPGEVIVDGYTVPIEADAPPGGYYLDVGYYLVVGESAINLPLVIDGQMSDDSSVTIGPIKVVAP